MLNPVVHCGRFTLSPSCRILVLRYVDVDWEVNHYEMSDYVVNTTQRKLMNYLGGMVGGTLEEPVDLPE